MAKTVMPAGMVAWDGQGKPSDYNGGPALQRNGRMCRKVFDWRHHGPDVQDGQSDIMAYTPK